MVFFTTLLETINVISILPLNHAMALSLLKAWFHNYMLAYAQSARSDNSINQKDGNHVMASNSVTATKYMSTRKMINRIYFRIYTTQINTNHLPHCTIQVNSYSSIICEREKKTTTNTTGFKMGWLYNSIILKFSKVILWTLILILHFVSSKIFHQWKANRCTIYNFMVI